jgi:benzoyl-CoA 2,3-dioxygenase component B
MLTEEAHHMFVGETGVGRVVERTADVMVEHKVSDPAAVRKLGVVDLPTVQRYLNLWYTLSLDLFGGEISSNAASFFATGIKGRAKEAEFEDHKALAGTYTFDAPKDGGFVKEEVPLRNAMNEVLRDAYVIDCQRGVDKWNRVLESHGLDFRLTLPSRRFHRQIGLFADVPTDPAGNLVTKEAYAARQNEWLPSDADKAFVQSLQQRPIYDPKQMAGWIAAPKHGIKGRPIDFEYVRHNEG